MSKLICIKNLDVAEICESIIGDGWVESSEMGMYLTGDPVEDKDYYDYHIAPLFSKYFIAVSPKMYPYWSVYGFHTYKQVVIKKLISLGIQKGKKVYIAKFPGWVFKNKQFMISALRGFFDTDGSFYCKKCYGKYDNEFRKKYHCQPRIEINSTSKKIILQCSFIIKGLGLTPGSIKLTKAGVKCGKNCRESYAIRLID